jgi:hypothetical protein
MSDNPTNVGLGCTNVSKIPPCSDYLKGALPKIVEPGSSVSVYVNATTGSDANTGANSSAPVQTLQRALDLMQFNSADLGIVEITSTTLALGANPLINFFPLNGRYGRVIIRGPKTQLASDIVASTAIFAPNMIGINGTTGGYTAAAFAKKYAVNRTTTYDTRTQIITNTGSNISTIDSAESGAITSGLTPAVWTAGDSFQVFDISTVLSWTGNLRLQIAPENKVIFDSLIIRPGTNAEFESSPRPMTTSYLVHFRSCQLESVGSALGATYIGNFIIEGCYCLSALASNRFLNYGGLLALNNYAERVCIRLQNFPGIIAALFVLNSETAGGVFCANSKVYLTEISTSGGAGADILNFNQSTQGQVIQVLQVAAAATPFRIDRSSIDLSNATIGVVAGAVNSFVATRGSIANLFTVTISDPGNVAAGSAISGSRASITAVTITGSSTHGLTINNGSSVNVVTSLSVSNALGAGILVDQGSELTGNAGSSIVGTGSTSVGMSVVGGSHGNFPVRPTITGTAGNAFVGNAPGPQAAQTWAVLANRVPGQCNDFAVNPTQNCFIFTA